MKLQKPVLLILFMLCSIAARPDIVLATPLKALTTATFRPGTFFSDFQYNWDIRAEAPGERFNDVEIQVSSLANLDLSSYRGLTGSTAAASPNNPNVLRITLPPNPNSADSLYSSLGFRINSVSNPNVVEGFPNVSATVDGAQVASTRSRAPNVGTLSTRAGASITGSQLRSWIDEFIPAQSNRFVEFAQCFGGNMVSEFAGLNNTAVASATSPGETAKVGFYDKDSAGALRPGTVFTVFPFTRDRTAQDVHDGGVSSKHSSENPITGGGLPLGDFSLANTSATGAVQSRHVLFFSGNPLGTTPQFILDEINLRDTIRNNFAGQTNTTFTAVGFNGIAQGWDLAGTSAGLRQALQQIGNAITAAPDLGKEQFIFYGSDHGNQDIVVQRAPVPVAAGGQGGFQGFPTFTRADLNPNILLNDPNNIPGFTVFIPFTGGLAHSVSDPFAYSPFFQPGDWTMQVDNGAGVVANLGSFTEKFLELGGDGIIGDQAGEGMQLYFPMDESLFVSSFFDVFTDITVFNHTLGTSRAGTYTILEFDQDTGNIAKEVIPEPGTMLLLGLGLLALVLGRISFGRAGWRVDK